MNFEGPNGKPDPLAAAIDIRETFGRMAMNDEETVAQLLEGIRLGKPTELPIQGSMWVPNQKALLLEMQSMGWNNLRTGNAADTITSGLEGAWTTSPAKWDNNYFENFLVMSGN